MLNSSQSNGDNNSGPKPVGELRAFVATMLGGHSWVVDLLRNYELVIGRDPESDIRIDVRGISPKHATLQWDGEQILVRDCESESGVRVNGELIVGSNRIDPGDAIEIGPASLVVNITIAPVNKGRRSLTHQEFAERLTEELSRAGRGGRPTCLVMLKSKSGDGARLADAALSTFRAGDIVATYAHDEIEFLLPDSPPKVARAVLERLLETSATEGAHVGLAVAPGDGDAAERLVRAARDALANSIRTGQTISRTGMAEAEPTEPSAHTETTRMLLREITEAAQHDEPVLFVGEPNTGKRQYARLVHDKSPRASGPFVIIQCAGLVDQESITRAFGEEAGKVDNCVAETARGGTLVLDEVGDLPLQGQRRLLKLFAQGSEDYGVVATTHRDLSALCQIGAFLRDLHQKIGMRKVEIPALRMRTESIVPLAKNFAEQYKPNKPIKLSEGAIEKMRSYAWPGNVLELRNAMERAVTLADGGEILAEHLPGDLTDTGDGGRLRDHVGSVERDAIIKALADNNYNQTHAARLLGISRRALIYKMEKYGLKPPPAGTTVKK